jgi:hypothetical protein
MRQTDKDRQASRQKGRQARQARQARKRADRQAVMKERKAVWQTDKLTDKKAGQ